MYIVSIIANSIPHEKIIDRKDYNVPLHYLEKLKLACKTINKDSEIIFIMLPYDIEKINYYIKISDAILSIGGCDINPILYNQENKFCNRINDLRYNFENLLIKEFLKTNKPFLGICAGMQILNVSSGGNLYQDIKAHSHEPFIYDDLHHVININQDSRLYSILQNKTIKVNSYHHQAIKNLGNNLSSVAFSEDGIIEAIEIKDHKFCIGVQWHPECMKDTDQIFTAFIKSLFI